MKIRLLLISAVSLSACTAHVGFQEIGSALRSGALTSARASNPSYQKPSQEDCAIYATAKAAESARADLQRWKVQATNTQAALAQNPAWSNGICSAPPMRSIPAKPQTLSEDEVTFQAIGSCIDLAARRQGMNDLAQALISVRREKLLILGEKWKTAKQEECALSYMPSQANDWAARALCGAFGREAYSACIMENLKKCILEVTNQCAAPLTKWQQDVAEIQSEPENLLRSCEEHVEFLQQAEVAIPKLEITMRLNAEEHDRLASANPKSNPSVCGY